MVRRSVVLSRHTRLGLWFLASLCPTFGCSFILDYDAEQCAIDADCAARGDGFAGTVCMDGVCVAPSTSSGPGGNGGSTGGCVSNTQCVQDNGGLPYHCVTPGEPCVSLLSEDCIELFPPDAYNDDNTVVFGFAADLTSSFSFQGNNMKQSSTMALDEIAKSVNGLPIAPGGERSPFMAVICDDNVDRDRAYNHLVETLKVEALICASHTDDCQEIANNITIPAGALHLNWHGTVPFADLDDDGTVINYRVGHQRSSRLYPLMVEEIETKFRTDNALMPSDQIKLAIVHVGGSDFELYVDELEKFLEINGQPINTQVNTFYRRYAPGLQTSQQEIISDASQIVDDILNNYQANIVMLGWPVGGGEAIIGPLEDMWPNGVPRPEYMSMLKEVTVPTTVQARPADGLVGRVRGMWLHNPNANAFNAYAARLSSWTDGLTPALWSEMMYDATYQLAISYVLKKDVPIVTGKDLAAGIFEQNAPGVAFSLADDINDAVQTALSGDIDADGVSGHLEFDPDVGDLLSQNEAWCVADDGNGTYTFVFAGELFDPATFTKSGTYCCPSPTQMCPGK